MRVLDLFSGIGGFSLGLERAGFQTIAFCEIDPFCRKVLKKHWPDVTIHEDITSFDGEQYAGSVDLICGGYPCQPFSTAGQRRGERDERHLWPEMRRVIRSVRPRWVICENVAGHIRLGFDEVAAQMEADGFTVWPFIVPASAVGAPHRRDRVWIVAHTLRCGRGSEPGEQQEERATLANTGCKGNVADANRTGLPQRKSSAVFSAGRWEEGGAVTERGWWETESEVGRMVDALPGRVDRLKCLGNSVVPEIPYRIGRAIRAYEQHLNLKEAA